MDKGGIDVVVPLGRGSKFRNCELRYFLRSLERYAKGIRGVVIIGDDPGFLSGNVKHSFTPFFDMNKEARIMHKVLWAFENMSLTDEILFANDDYVFTKPFDAREIKPFHRGSLLERSSPKEEGKDRNGYQLALFNTHEALIKAKLPAFDYDCHVPIRFDKKRFMALKPWFKLSATTKPTGLVGKSLYANNVYRPTPGPRIADMKIYSYTDDIAFQAYIQDRWQFSYSDKALFRGLEKSLFKMFPDRSKFEAN
jgi:hypothetical protein